MLRDLRENRNGLVGHWLPAWETPAFVDASGRGGLGTNSGTTLKASERGIVREFDGSNDSILIGERADYTPASLTVMAWARFDTTTARQQFCGIYDAAGGERSWCFGHPAASGNKVALGVSSDGINFNFQETVANAFSVAGGRWNHFAATYSGSVASITIYVDGEDEPLTTYASSGTPSGALHVAADSLYLGRVTVQSGNPNYFDGGISDVRIYNRALPAAEIRDIYGRTREPYSPRRRVYSVTAAPPAGNRRRRLLIGSG